jgi:hypothetical protein
MTRRFFSAVLALCVLATFAASTVTAAGGDPVVSVTTTAPALVGSPVTLIVTIDQDGFAPLNGSQKITYTNPVTFATVNVANYTVIPVTYANGVWTYTYTPRPSEAGRVETFSVRVPVSTARIPRYVTGAVRFAPVFP